MNETKIATAIIKKELEGIKETLQILNTEKNGNILRFLLEALRGEKGDKGDQGAEGKMGPVPVYGKDFMTDKDVNELAQLVFAKIELPVAGKNYFTEADKKKFLLDLKKFMPKVGKDFYTVAEKKNFIKQITGLMNAKTVVINRSIEEVKKEAGDKFIVGDGVRKVTVSTVAPLSPAEGDLWVDVS